jgi:hypothetical protein
MPRLAVATVALAALVLLGGGGLFVLQLRANSQAATTGHGAGCRPEPCADAGGYQLHVQGVRIDGRTVRMEVVLTVRGRSNMHSVPDDFTLIDAGKRHAHPVFDAAGCHRWPRTRIPDGTTLGPLPLCFRPASVSPPLLLNWSPDLGITEYFSGGYDLPIR